MVAIVSRSCLSVTGRPIIAGKSLRFLSLLLIYPAASSPTVLVSRPSSSHIIGYGRRATGGEGEDCAGPSGEPREETPADVTRGDGPEGEGKTPKVAAKKDETPAEDKCPLAKAVLGGREKLAKELLKSGADVSRRDHDGRTPLHHAAVGGRHRICSLLLRGGADEDAQDKQGDSPLLLAVGRGHVAVVKALLSANAGVEARGSRGMVALEVVRCRR